MNERMNGTMIDHVLLTLETFDVVLWKNIGPEMKSLMGKA